MLEGFEQLPTAFGDRVREFRHIVSDRGEFLLLFLSRFAGCPRKKLPRVVRYPGEHLVKGTELVEIHMVDRPFRRREFRIQLLRPFLLVFALKVFRPLFLGFRQDRRPDRLYVVCAQLQVVDHLETCVFRHHLGYHFARRHLFPA